MPRPASHGVGAGAGAGVAAATGATLTARETAAPPPVPPVKRARTHTGPPAPTAKLAGSEELPRGVGHAFGERAVEHFEPAPRDGPRLQRHRGTGHRGACERHQGDRELRRGAAAGAAGISTSAAFTGFPASRSTLARIAGSSA